MKFFRIEMLFLIWIIPLLFLIVVYGMRKRRNVLAKFSSARGLSAIAPEATVQRRWIKALLILAALFFMVFALSGPRYGYKWQEIERKGIDIIIAIDCSKSMLATDIRPTRLDRAKREIFDLLNLIKGDRVGLVSFAGTAFLQCPLTLDYEAFYLFLNALTTDFLPVGGTDIAGAITTALAGFNSQDDSQKAVILITDGESTGGDPIIAAEQAQKAGVKLFCIGVGKTDGAPIPDTRGGFIKDKSGNIIISRLDEDTLQKAAVLTGGTYVRSVAGDMDLDTIYNRDIRGKMDAAILSSGRKQIWEDRYQWFLVLALLALVAEMFLPEIRKTTLAVVLGLALVFNPSYVSAAGVYQSMQKGKKAYDNQEYDKALKSFIDAQLEEPDQPGIYYNIGNAYYKISDYSSAYENYTQALKSENNALKQKTFYNRANTYYRMGKLKDAISDYEAALKLDPDDREAAQNLEFVKKMMEMQKQQKPEDSGQRTEDKSQKSEKQDAEKPAPEYGKSLDSKPAAENNGAAASRGVREDQDKPASGMPEPKPDQDPDRMKQAERILNRLQDMPGKALMPVYRERRIEKDW